MSYSLQKREPEIQKSMKSSMQLSQGEGKLNELKSQTKIGSRQFLDRVIGNGGIYDATSFASLLGLAKEELISDDILMYCSFDLEINCKYLNKILKLNLYLFILNHSHKSELKIFKSSGLILY
jgi:hypothetical protein